MNTLAHRPTENAAVYTTSKSAPVLPPLEVLLDLVINARATGDRYGARHFDCMLDRHPAVQSLSAPGGPARAS